MKTLKCLIHLCVTRLCDKNDYCLWHSFHSCHKRFAQLDPDAVKINANAKLPSRKIMTLPELRVCNFVLLKCDSLTHRLKKMSNVIIHCLPLSG